jgi:hypothetical protein
VLLAVTLPLMANQFAMLIHPTPGSIVWPAAMIVWGPDFTVCYKNEAKRKLP